MAIEALDRRQQDFLRESALKRSINEEQMATLSTPQLVFRP